ncbi:MAG TPA: class I SAM-dependent methyltransferase [Fimbriimonas sp.]
MENKSFLMPHAFWQYVESTWMREPEILRRLREETATMPNAGLQISADQGQLMTLLVRLMGARRALEIGVFTGYSSIAVALGLPPDGELVACDVSDEYTAVACRYWQEAGISDRVKLHLGPAADTLKRLVEEGQEGTFDVAFIDADKPSYPTYYELCLMLLRQGGMLLVDNVFWSGKVADDKINDEGTVQMRSFNAQLAIDDRIDLAIIPIGDGLTIARKR